MAVTDHRPNGRDSTASWQTYADLLEAEVERLQEQRALDEARHAADLTARERSLEAEVERLREALRFYAEFYDDLGRRAREALDA